MDFRHRYYKTNKVLLKCIGLWPYQTTRVRRGIGAVLLFITAGHGWSQLMACVKYRNNKDILMECILVLIFVVSCLMKVTCTAWNVQKILTLLNHIRTDWQAWAQDQEINILHRYADQGRKITIAYTVMAHFNGGLFIIQPVIPKIIDVLLKNGSEPGVFPIPVDYYFIDMQKYYFYLIVYSGVCACVAILVTAAVDAIFIVYVQHGCGIFAAVGHKLERVRKNHRTTETGKPVFALAKKDMDFEHLVSCIVKHSNAIEYAELIEATYSWYFLSVLILNTLMISLTGIQNPASLGQGELVQRPNKSGLLSCRHNCKWYSLSKKSQKICLFMLMRFNIPCQLTAGKIVVISLKTFQGFLNTSVSYFMLLRTM